MNIFVLSALQKKSATMYCDKHVVKIILEIAQLLSTANPLHPRAYRATHKHHPWAIAVRRSSEVYLWAATMGLQLCREYTHRYGKVHKCEERIQALLSSPPPPTGEKFRPGTTVGLVNGLELPVCTNGAVVYRPDGSVDVVWSYRIYYRTDKLRLLSYRKRERPTWLPSRVCEV